MFFSNIKNFGKGKPEKETLLGESTLLQVKKELLNILILMSPATESQKGSVKNGSDLELPRCFFLNEDFLNGFTNKLLAFKS